MVRTSQPSRVAAVPGRRSVQLGCGYQNVNHHARNNALLNDALRPEPS